MIVEIHKNNFHSYNTDFIGINGVGIVFIDNKTKQELSFTNAEVMHIKDDNYDNSKHIQSPIMGMYPEDDYQMPE